MTVRYAFCRLVNNDHPNVPPPAGWYPEAMEIGTDETTRIAYTAPPTEVNGEGEIVPTHSFAFCAILSEEWGFVSVLPNFWAFPSATLDVTLEAIGQANVAAMSQTVESYGLSKDAWCDGNGDPILTTPYRDVLLNIGQQLYGAAFTLVPFENLV